MKQNRPVAALLVAVLLVTAGCSGSETLPTPTVETTNDSTETAVTTTAQPSTTTTTTTTVSPTTETTATTTPQDTTTAFEDRTEFSGTVTEIVDGDTLKVRFENGRTETVRLLGVDTPEVHTEVSPDEFEGITDSDRGRSWLQDWGSKASSYAKQTLSGKTIRVVVDEEADRRGNYGRLLAYVYVEGEMFNEQLLKRGYARLYESEFSERSSFESVERIVQKQDRGLWAFEKQSNENQNTGSSSLVVASIHEDASGNDHENLNDEYIQLKNTGSSSLDLGGWTVSDSAGHSYTFPSGSTFGAGESLTLYSGSGSSGGSNYYWGSGSAIWNNGGDTIIVKDSSGSTVTREEY